MEVFVGVKIVNFENYIREIELIIKQNNVEVELYSLIKE